MKRQSGVSRPEIAASGFLSYRSLLRRSKRIESWRLRFQSLWIVTSLGPSSRQQPRVPKQGEEKTLAYSEL